MTEFEWDETKRRANLAKHGVDFAEVEEFDWQAATVETDLRRNYGEPRFIAIGTFDGQMHVIIFTPRKNAIRIISFRRAKRKEVRRHEKEKNRSR